jgi:CheY-like chemotaxis protein
MNVLRLNLPLLYVFSRFFNDVEHKTTRIKNTLIIMLAVFNKKSPHILLADDDREDREIFISAVQQVEPSIKVSVALNGHELMKTLLNSETLPDILFLDLNMPLKNGQECLEEIRSNEKLKSLPVVIYSTSSNREYIDQTYKGGANYYLPKPDSLKELKLITEKLFSLDWAAQSHTQKEKFVLNLNQIK